MFSFFKRPKNEIEIPQWASFFNKSEYVSFIEAIDKFFYKKNITYTLNDDASINVGPNDFGLDILGLTNLAQICKQGEVRNYYELASGHFDAMIRASRFEKNFKEIINDYNAIEQYLATRLYPLKYLEYGGKKTRFIA